MSRLEPTTSTPLPSLDLLRVIGNYGSWKRKDEGEGKNNKFTFWNICNKVKFGYDFCELGI